jgi:hypothetical protein
MRLGEGLIRFSVGLDHDIRETSRRIEKCLKETGIGRKKA